jgi:hypothetical protein
MPEFSTSPSCRALLSPSCTRAAADADCPATTNLRARMTRSAGTVTASTSLIRFRMLGRIQPASSSASESLAMR